ncbi:unnamed protein product, partial [Rotaria sp. Silwood1]
MSGEQEAIDLTAQYNRAADNNQTDAANDLRNEIQSHIENC